MKKTLSLFLCICLLSGITACKNRTSPQALEKQLTQQLIDSKHLEGEFEGIGKTQVSAMGDQAIQINGKFQLDTSSGLPKYNLEGTIGIKGLMSLPFSIYGDENKTQTTVFGQSDTKELNDNDRNQMRQVLKLISENQANLSRSVEETQYENQKALKIQYDINQINSLLSSGGSSNTKVDQILLHYLLNNDNQPEKIIAYIALSGEEQMEIELKIKLNPTKTS